MENQHFEKQLHEVHQEVERKKQELGGDARHGVEKEILHEYVGERLGKTASDTDGDHGAAHSQKTEHGEVRSYQLPELRDGVQDLVNVAFEKNIDDAIKEARKTKNPALIDAFHDALVDYLYDHLVERGKLKRL